MPYDPTLAEQVRVLLAERSRTQERLMMGGIVFMLRGNLCCGVDKTDLIVRVGPAHYHEALAEAHVRPMDITGKPLKGWVLVGPKGYTPAAALKKWVQRGVDFASSLPPKASKKTTPKRVATKR